MMKAVDLTPSPAVSAPSSKAMQRVESNHNATFRQPVAPLSVLLVVEPGLDGVFRHVEGLVGFLAARQVRIHLAYSSRRISAGMRELAQRVRASGGEVLDMRVANVPELADCAALARLIAMIRRTQPDIVHAHSSKAGALARAAAWILRHKRYIYTPHAYYGMAKPRSLKIGFFNQIERVLGRLGLTIAISRDEAKFAHDVLGIDADRVSVIHNPVDTKRFQPPTAEERKAARAALGIPDKAVVLATIGRMCWQKDPETAYAAVAPVCAQNPDLLFVHLGWGKWKNYLLGYAEELGFGRQLKIVDYTNDPRSVYHAMDGLVVSSRYEAGWPLVALEAMACDIPIVSSTCMGMSDIGRAGLSHLWTFAPGDIKGCTEAMQSWLSNRRDGTLKCNHRSFSTERLSPERCYGAVLELYLNGSSIESVAPVG
jgi:glycosyltransferase involved in cell wall biosynthesis